MDPCPKLAKAAGLRHAYSMKCDRRRWLGGVMAAGAAGLAFASAPGLARAAFCRIWQPPGTVEFTVFREGEKVGHHRVAYARQGGDYLVRTDIGIEVEALGLPIFRFTHTAEEVWREGWLHALTSDTDDDGTQHSIRAERNTEGIFEMLADNRYRRTVSGYIIPSSLWHRDTIHSQGLLDTIDGHVKLVQTYRIDERGVTFQGERVEARGYAVVGQINRKVWYDESCRLVRVAFLARDGSEIVLETG